jgi:uncharacterized protein YjbI with pentapeptide repeats
MNADQNREVWERLVQGKPLGGLGLGMKDGRLDLSGLLAPEPALVKTVRTPLADVSALDGITVLDQIKWESLDFSGSRLNGLRFQNCRISDCVFNECDCRDWRLWETTVLNTTFSSADLRKSALGGVQENRVNTFQKVDFTRADLRQTAYVSARFVGCLFRSTRLNKVNFQGSAFTDCSFEGELREVCFNRRAFGASALPPNEMLRVDFTRANLRSVEFRGLDLSDVCFPMNPDHILLNAYPQSLDRLLQELRDRTEMGSKKLAAYLSVYRKWTGPKQSKGVLNKNDLLEIGGEDGLKVVLEMIKTWHS